MKINTSVYRHGCRALAGLLCGIVGVMVTSCADDDLTTVKKSSDTGINVRFNTTDVQELSIAQTGKAPKALPGTRALSASELLPQRHEAFSTDGLGVSLVETTVDGVNPVKTDAQTRATVKTAIDANFSSFGYRGTSEQGISNTPEWFYNADTKSDGELVSPLPWSWDIPYARFYGIYPKIDTASKLKLSEATYAGKPYVDFESETDVTKQVDLLTACSGVVHYNERGVAPRPELKFRHALCAVRFAIGSNLSWNKTIDKVEVRNVKYKGRYTLSDQTNGTGATWDVASDRITMALSGVKVNTSKNPNTIIMGTEGDNYTFFMVPQTITAEDNVVVYFHCSDGTEITAKLKSGNWQAGHTKTYTISQKESDWTYHIEATNPTAIDYDKNVSPDAYSILSYRIAPDGTKQPVGWKVVGYDANGDGTFSMDEKPSWLTSFDKSSGEGGDVAETGSAHVTININNQMSERNQQIANAPAKGSSTNYYNLANQTNGGNTIENTANSYLISAPGYYRLPLVYGNAIKNGTKNEAAYKTDKDTDTGRNKSTKVMEHFIDHNGKPIKSPYIMVQNPDNKVGTPEVVWADVKGLVSNLKVTGTGSGAYLQFEVKKATIQNGNAVIAIKDVDGNVLWSWHIWVAPADALSPITCYNEKEKAYKFAKEPLGFKYNVWNGSTYSVNRSVKVRVEQVAGHKGAKQYADITVTQKTGGKKEHTMTYYEFGRKDAFPKLPGKPENGGGECIESDEQETVQKGIQNPNTVYTNYNDHSEPWYINLWCANYRDEDDRPTSCIKTIYDPSPVGYRVPEFDAFTGFFTIKKSWVGDKQHNWKAVAHTQGEWNDGFNFITEPKSSGSPIFFPKMDEYYWGALDDPTVLYSWVGYWASGAVTKLRNFNIGFGFYYYKGTDNDEARFAMTPGFYRSTPANVRSIVDE